MSTKNYDIYNQDDRDYHTDQTMNASVVQNIIDDNDPNRRTLDEEKADEDEDEDEDELEEDAFDDDDIDQKNKSDI